VAVIEQAVVAEVEIEQPVVAEVEIEQLVVAEVEIEQPVVEHLNNNNKNHFPSQLILYYPMNNNYN
jgi:ubiquinone biosynthesis protein COQ9